jgi:hypothetical protein
MGDNHHPWIGFHDPAYLRGGRVRAAIHRSFQSSWDYVFRTPRKRRSNA